MSEQHTQEPWKFIDVIGGCSVYAGRREVLRYSFSPDAENKANARRIVACVNACAGIPTDDLEMSPHLGIFHLAEFSNNIVMQRDKLLDALKTVINNLSDDDEEGLLEHVSYIKDARAVIAEVEANK